MLAVVNNAAALSPNWNNRRCVSESNLSNPFHLDCDKHPPHVTSGSVRAIVHPSQ